jgi:hypothetical protein
MTGLEDLSSRSFPSEHFSGPRAGIKGGWSRKADMLYHYINVPEILYIRYLNDYNR